jgi:threonine dehydrogenase-like Zn-dependent dehydrogenase
MTRFLNQKGLIDENKLAETRFVVVGAGAIGSFYVTMLSKMGARSIVVYDMDVLEDHNFANQLYPIHLLDSPKVDALKSVALSYGECEITPKAVRWTPDNAVDGDIVVAAVDNMDVRKAVFDHYKTRCKFIIDGRMAAQFMMVYGVDTSNKEAVDYYEKKWYPQKDAMAERCGHKSIIYTVAQVSGEMLSQTKKFIMGEYRPTETIFDALNNRLTTKYHMERKLEVIEQEEKEVVEVK